jgi:hypothetical protein
MTGRSSPGRELLRLRRAKGKLARSDSPRPGPANRTTWIDIRYICISTDSSLCDHSCNGYCCYTLFVLGISSQPKLSTTEVSSMTAIADAPAPTGQSKPMRLGEAAKGTVYTRQTLLRCILTGVKDAKNQLVKLKGIRVGKQFYVTKEHLDEFFERLTTSYVPPEEVRSPGERIKASIAAGNELDSMAPTAKSAAGKRHISPKPRRAVATAS